MEWQSLTKEELEEFLTLYYGPVQRGDILPQTAEKLFNNLTSRFGNNFRVTKAVADLYLRQTQQPHDRDNMSNIPEDLQYYIAQGLDLESLTKLCASNKAIRNICEDEKLWREKSSREFSLSEFNTLLVKLQDPELVYLTLVVKYNKRAALLSGNQNLRRLSKFGEIDSVFPYKDKILVIFKNEKQAEKVRKLT